MSLHDVPWIDPRDAAALIAMFIPSSEVAAAFGLALRARFGRGGTPVGLGRAQTLSARIPVIAPDMRVIANWFACHGAGPRGPGWGDSDRRSAGWIAWHPWGGDVRRAWVESERQKWMARP